MNKFSKVVIKNRSYLSVMYSLAMIRSYFNCQIFRFVQLIKDSNSKTDFSSKFFIEGYILTPLYLKNSMIFFILNYKHTKRQFNDVKNKLITYKQFFKNHCHSYIVIYLFQNLRQQNWNCQWKIRQLFYMIRYSYRKNCNILRKILYQAAYIYLKV